MCAEGNMGRERSKNKWLGLCVIENDIIMRKDIANIKKIVPIVI